MIADALRLEIEQHATRVLEHNRLLRQAKAGDVDPEAIGRYLEGLRFMIGNTQGNLALAQKVAAARGDEALVDYYRNKRREEEGHEQWAEDDLAAFVAAFGFRPEPVPVPAIEELQQMLRKSIDNDPRCYLAYVFWAEYFVVLAGGEFVRALVERCGLPPQALTCLAKHIVLDEGHTDENLDAIDRLVPQPSALMPMRDTLRRTVALFDEATEQMLEPATSTERVAS